MKILVDKIASVAKNAKLSHELNLGKQIQSEEGALLVVKVLEDKKTYNKLELASGRLSILRKGEILVVALGNRRALKGFVGKVPEKLKIGDTINILNIGGVAGICTSENIKEVGHALKVKVLGSVADEKNSNKAMNIAQFKKFSPTQKLKSKIPLIIVSGTCMNVGKTSVSCEILKYAHRKKLICFAAKLTGVAALKDTANMKDSGAKKVVSFIDAGFTSTANGNQNKSIKITKGAINHLAEGRPDLIVIEFGDGVFGEYGVMKILKDKEIQKHIAAHIGCAHDPMGASKLAEVCKKLGAPLDVISGPVTDNSVGVEFIAKNLHLPAFNALFSGKKLFEHVLKTIKNRT